MINRTLRRASLIRGGASSYTDGCVGQRRGIFVRASAVVARNRATLQ